MERKIDDHSFWAGKGGKHSVLPESVKTKSISDVEGAGGVMDYPDTEGHIARDQHKGISKMNSHKIKDGYRY